MMENVAPAIPPMPVTTNSEPGIPAAGLGEATAFPQQIVSDQAAGFKRTAQAAEAGNVPTVSPEVISVLGEESFLEARPARRRAGAGLVKDFNDAMDRFSQRESKLHKAIHDPASMRNTYEAFISKTGSLSRSSNNHLSGNTVSPDANEFLEFGRKILETQLHFSETGVVAEFLSTATKDVITAIKDLSNGGGGG